MNKWLLCGALLGLGIVQGVSAQDKKGGSPVLEQKMTSLAGKPVELSEYKGKVLLIVNTASRCGATPQYEDLQALHEKYSKEGLVVLGFPCNQFGKQEPGDSEQIATFCKKNYGVSFPMFAKVDVNGDEACDLFKYLTSEEAYPQDAGKVKWNFEKFLVNREGKVVGRFRTSVNPSSKPVVEAIERELKPAT
jgi:glutathione peroxidase